MKKKNVQNTIHTKYRHQPNKWMNVKTGEVDRKEEGVWVEVKAVSVTTTKKVTRSSEKIERSNIPK